MENGIKTKKELKQALATNVFFFVMEVIGFFLLVGLAISIVDATGNTSTLFLLVWAMVKILAVVITSVVVSFDAIKTLDNARYYMKELKARYGWEKGKGT